MEDHLQKYLEEYQNDCKALIEGVKGLEHVVYAPFGVMDLSDRLLS